MLVNTLHSDLAGCPLSLHKIQVASLGGIGEEVVFGHIH